MASDRLLARVRGLLRRRARPHRIEDAPERRSRRIGARIHAAGQEPRSRHPAVRLRVPAQRFGASRRACVSLGDRGRPRTDGANASSSGHGARVGDRPLRAAHGARDSGVRRGEDGAGPRSASPSSAHDRRGRSRERRRDQLEQGPAPSGEARAAGHADRAAVRVRIGGRCARAAAGCADRGRRDVRFARTDQPPRPARQQREDDRAPDRDGRRRRLRPLLRDPIARGTPARPLVPRGARAHGRYVGPDGRDRRNDSRNRDGRPVRDRVGDLQRDRRGHDHGCSLCGGRLPHRAPGRARAARAAARPRPNPLPPAPAHGHEHVAVLATRE